MPDPRSSPIAAPPARPFRIEDVVGRGLCVGCGACSVATGGKVRITLRPTGVYGADLADADAQSVRLASSVCPFSDEAPNEDALDAPTAAGRALPHDEHVGRHGRVFAGRRTTDLLDSSSGGLTSWLLGALLTSGEVDSVIHVARSDDGDGLFGYVISTSLEQAETRKKSYYTAPTLAGVLEQAVASDQRHALVGVPCFIKAARALREKDPAVAAALPVLVGLVCGHLKSRYFAESLAWQAGVSPDRLTGFDFRVKNPTRPVNRYDYAAWANGRSEPVVREVASTLDGSWGTGAFQPGACDFCDDVFAETADVVFGDAWLPQYTDEWRGTNVVVTRNPTIDAIFDAGVERGEIEIDSLTVDDAIASQGGNFRHRRDGLAVRLADDIEAGLPVPRKRVQPDRQRVTAARVEVIRRRRAMSSLSLRAFAEARERGDFELYAAPMRRAIAASRTAVRPVRTRIVLRVLRVLRRH